MTFHVSVCTSIEELDFTKISPESVVLWSIRSNVMNQVITGRNSACINKSAGNQLLTESDKDENKNDKLKISSDNYHAFSEIKNIDFYIDIHILFPSF